MSYYGEDAHLQPVSSADVQSIAAALKHAKGNLIDIETAVKESHTATVELLARIAVALEAIAGDITERRERERAALVSQYAHLQAEARRAGERFSAADNSLTNRSIRGEAITQGSRDWAQRCETAMLDAQDALDAFRAAHPELAESLLTKGVAS